jgi:uncharacterized protein with von Willebrand factor type A (vWA) domain
MTFLYELRTQIEKTAKQHSGVYAHVGRFDPSELMKLPNRPPNAKSFFIGDSTGGSGWEIAMPDGAIEKFYVDLPENWEVRTGMVLLDAPQEYQQTDARVLIRTYLEKLATIIERAKEKFPSDATSVREVGQQEG